MERRTFLARVVQCCSGIILGLFLLPVFRFLRGSLAEEEESTWYPICGTDSITEEITQVQYTRVLRDGWLTRTIEDTVWVRKKSGGTFVVFEPHCTHLGCAYSWNPEAKQFRCPCHGGKFDADGNRIAGPPPRPLDRYEAKVEDRILKIGKVISRKGAREA